MTLADLMAKQKPELKEDIVDRPLLDGKHVPSYMILEWNRGTKKFFDKGKHPRKGRRYCFKCIGFDGVRGYFALESI